MKLVLFFLIGYFATNMLQKTAIKAVNIRQPMQGLLGNSGE